MSKMLKLAVLSLVASLTVGCATNSDITNLQNQIDDMKSSVSKASSDAASASASASEASSKAAAAEAAANRAASLAEDTNSKLDRMFKKSMMK